MTLIDDNKILVRVLQTVRIASHLSPKSPRTNSFQSSMSDYAQLEARVVDMRSVDCRSLRHVPEDPGSIPGFGLNLSAWRNVKTQCDTNATRDDGRSWLLLNHEWNDRPVARLQAGQCFNAQRSNSPRMVGGLAVIPHHLTVSCRFKSCRAHQFYRATLPFWPDQSGARRNKVGNYRPNTATNAVQIAIT